MTDVIDSLIGVDSFPKLFLFEMEEQEAITSFTKKIIQLNVAINTPSEERSQDTEINCNGTRRLAIIADSVSSLEKKLQEFAATEKNRNFAPLKYPLSGHSKIVFLYTGSGTQYPGMGRELFLTQSVFRNAIERCNEILTPTWEVSLLDVLYPKHELETWIHKNPYIQPALFSVQYALTELWKAFGIVPHAVLGHSTGEYAAACSAGVMQMEDALSLLNIQSRLMIPLSGRAVSVPMSAYRVNLLLEDFKESLSIASINSENNVTVAGSSKALDSLCALTQDIKMSPIEIPCAAHSLVMDPILDEFEKVVSKVKLSSPKIEYFSGVLGRQVGNEVSSPQYWKWHIRKTVQFHQAMEELVMQSSSNVFVEIGPSPTLISFGIQKFRKKGEWISSLRPKFKDWQVLLEGLAKIHLNGGLIDPSPKIQIKSQTVSPVVFPKNLKNTDLLCPLVDKMIRSLATKEVLFESTFSVEIVPWLANYSVDEQLILPTAYPLSMLLDAAKLAFEGKYEFRVDNIILPELLIIPEEGMRTVQVVFSPEQGSGKGKSYIFQMLSFDGQKNMAKMESHTHASGTVFIAGSAGYAERMELASLRDRFVQKMDLTRLYVSLAKQVVLDSAYRWLTILWQDASNDSLEVLGKLTAPEDIGNVGDYFLHPGLLDACFQMVVITAMQDDEISQPSRLESLQVYRPVTGREWWCHARQVDSAKWDIRLLDDQGHPIAVIDGCHLHTLSQTEQRLTSQDTLLGRLAKLPANANEREKQLQKYLRNEIASVLGLDDLESIGACTNLFTLGLDSFTAICLKNELEIELGYALRNTLLFDYPTLAKLTTYLLQDLLSSTTTIIEHEDKMRPPVQKICAVTGKSDMPLSFSQQDVWKQNQNQIMPHDTSYNLCHCYQLEGSINIGILEQSFNEIIRRHAILRTTFLEKNGVPMQAIATNGSLNIKMLDLSHLQRQEWLGEVGRLQLKEEDTPFYLKQGPLWRMKLLRFSESFYVLMLSIHHIVFDARSIDVLFKELAFLYKSFIMGEPSPLKPLSIQYADFSHWQREFFTPNVLQDRYQYWQQLLANKPDQLMLPTNKPSTPSQTRQTYSGGIEMYELSSELTQQLRSLGQSQGSTLPVVLLASYFVLLYQYSVQEDIVIGAPMSKRNHGQVEPLIGYFSGMSVLRINLAGKPNFLEILVRAHKMMQDAMENQDLSMKQVWDGLQLKWTGEQQLLFRTAFNFIPVKQDVIHLSGLTLTPMALNRSKMVRDLVIGLWDKDGSGKTLEGFLRYREDLFETEIIVQMVKNFQLLLASIVANPTQSIDKLLDI